MPPLSLQIPCTPYFSSAISSVQKIIFYPCRSGSIFGGIVDGVVAPISRISTLEVGPSQLGLVRIFPGHSI